MFSHEHEMYRQQCISQERERESWVSANIIAVSDSKSNMYSYLLSLCLWEDVSEMDKPR